MMLRVAIIDSGLEPSFMKINRLGLVEGLFGVIVNLTDTRMSEWYDIIVKNGCIRQCICHERG